MTEPPLKSPHISVKARAREINAKAAAAVAEQSDTGSGQCGSKRWVTQGGGGAAAGVKTPSAAVFTGSVRSAAARFEAGAKSCALFSGKNPNADGVGQQRGAVSLGACPECAGKMGRCLCKSTWKEEVPKIAKVALNDGTKQAGSGVICQLADGGGIIGATEIIQDGASVCSGDYSASDAPQPLTHISVFHTFVGQERKEENHFLSDWNETHCRTKELSLNESHSCTLPDSNADRPVSSLSDPHASSDQQTTCYRSVCCIEVDDGEIPSSVGESSGEPSNVAISAESSAFPELISRRREEHGSGFSERGVAIFNPLKSSSGSEGAWNSASIFREQAAAEGIVSHSDERRLIKEPRSPDALDDDTPAQDGCFWDEIFDTLDKICDEFSVSSTRVEPVSDGKEPRLLPSALDSDSGVCVNSKCRDNTEASESEGYFYCNVPELQCSSDRSVVSIDGSSDRYLSEEVATDSGINSEYAWSLRQDNADSESESLSSLSSHFRSHDGVSETHSNGWWEDVLLNQEEFTMDGGLSSGIHQKYNWSRKDDSPKVALVPNLLVTTLTKVPPSPTKSLLLPSSPSSPLPHVRSKPELPSYLTLGRRARRQQNSDAKLADISRCDNEEIGEEELEKIRSILAALDFSKYRRARGGNTTELHRTNYNPLPSHRIPITNSLPSEKIMDKTPGSPRSNASRSQNTRLKDLTEKLKPQSPNLNEVSSMSANSSSDKPQLVNRSSSFSQVDVASDGSLVRANMPSNKSVLKNAHGSSTLPRRRAGQLERTDDTEIRESDSLDHFTDSSNISDREKCPTSDSGGDSVVDEGLVADSDSSSSYAYAYNTVTGGTFPRASKLKNTAAKNSGLYTALSSENLKIKGGGGGAPKSDFLSAAMGEKRKRRKGIGCPSVGFQSSPHEPCKTGNGRSLTYPPQRKSSISEEELEYTSVDSNCLKSLNMAPGGMGPTSHDALRQPSDLSLADSHFCPSESTGEETYQDVMESVTSMPTDMNRLSVEDRNGKALKKKHHSDPGGDKNTGQCVDLPELIATCKSEPELGETKENVKDGHKNEGLKLEIREPISEPSGSMSATVLPTQPLLHKLTSGTLTPSPLTCSGVRFATGDLSDKEFSEKYSSKSPQQQRRYSKKRLRGPYGEMLEEEMRKSGKQKSSISTDPLNIFIQELSGESSRLNDTVTASTTSTPVIESSPRPNPLPTSQSLDDSQLKRSTQNSEPPLPKRKISANIPLVGESETHQYMLSPPQVTLTSSEPNLHQSGGGSVELDYSVSKHAGWTQEVEGLPQPSKEHSVDEPARTGSLKRHQDTRTHVVGELYDTEKSYVESLQILVNKYMRPLKSSEHVGLVDAALVDEIFYQIPEILSHHEAFLEVLRQRLANWDSKQKVGDVFVEAFTKQPIIDTYTAFINNWKSAKEAIKLGIQAKPGFAKFLEHMSREHKGKLTLDALLIMPVQRIPRYELLIKELLKHTHVDHPDHQLLVLAQKEVHDLAVKINRMEKEAYQHEQMQQRVKEIELLVEGVMDLVQPDRTFIQYDLVNIPGGLGTKKERCLFLFSDLLIITSIKKKSGTIRKTSAAGGSPSSLVSSLEMNKYKLLMRFSLDNLDIGKSADANVKKVLKEIESLQKDFSLLGQINELVSGLNCQHQALDEALKELLNAISKQLSEKQNSDSQLLTMELTVTSQEGVDNLTIIFPTPDKRAAWEAAFNEAKQKLALSTDRRPPPEFMYPLPIRKTRAGLQFTCATATLGLNQHGMRDVWVCNSDGYVGQVCVLSLQPDPTVTSCNGVCNARILCIASIPASNSIHHGSVRRRSVIPDSFPFVTEECDESRQNGEQRGNNGNFQLDSDSSEDDDEGTDSQDDELQGEGGSSSSPREEKKEEADNQQPTMWLGTEDGCVHVYNCNDNIRIKKNKIKIQVSAAVHCIIYLDNRVFVSLSSGELCIYRRDLGGSWNTTDPQKVQVGNSSAPVTRMLAVAGKLWCGCLNNIKVLNTTTLEVEHTFQVSSDTTRAVLCMVTSGLGVWLAIQHSAVVRLFHATTYECLLDVNVAPAVTKMLAGCDDIIRQHKAACLRVTALLACKDLLWVGTSAGVILTLPLPHLTSTTTRLDTVPNVAGIPHGHTGHVRFLTSVEIMPGASLDASGCAKYSHRSLRSKEGLAARRASTCTATAGGRLLVVSGGDGYEDFRNTGLSEAAGRDDSTNHLLIWQV